MARQFRDGAQKSVRPMNQPLREQPQGEGISKLAEMFKSRPTAHEPIIKSLEKIGVNPKVMILPINEEPTDCIVIPVDLLMLKEYQFMSGIDIQAIHEKANMSIEPQREEQEDEQHTDAVGDSGSTATTRDEGDNDT